MMRAYFCLLVLLLFVRPMAGCAPPPEVPVAGEAFDAALAGLGALGSDTLLVGPSIEARGAVAIGSVFQQQAAVRISDVHAHHDVATCEVAYDDGERGLLFGRIRSDGIFRTLVLLAPREGLSYGSGLDAYQEAWEAEDDAGREEAYDKGGFSEDGRYVDPTVDVTGREELGQMIDNTKGMFPGATIIGAEAPTYAAGRWVAFTWQMQWPAGIDFIPGYDVAEIDQFGEVAGIHGFFEMLPGGLDPRAPSADDTPE